MKKHIFEVVAKGNFSTLNEDLINVMRDAIALGKPTLLVDCLLIAENVGRQNASKHLIQRAQAHIDNSQATIDLLSMESL